MCSCSSSALLRSMPPPDPALCGWSYRLRLTPSAFSGPPEAGPLQRPVGQQAPPRCCFRSIAKWTKLDVPFAWQLVHLRLFDLRELSGDMPAQCLDRRSTRFSRLIQRCHPQLLAGGGESASLPVDVRHDVSSSGRTADGRANRRERELPAQPTTLLQLSLDESCPAASARSLRACAHPSRTSQTAEPYWPCSPS